MGEETDKFVERLLFCLAHDAGEAQQSLLGVISDFGSEIGGQLRLEIHGGGQGFERGGKDRFVKFHCQAWLLKQLCDSVLVGGNARYSCQ